MYTGMCFYMAFDSERWDELQGASLPSLVLSNLKGPKGFHRNTFIRLYRKLTTPNEHPISNQNAEIDCLISRDFCIMIYLKLLVLAST